MGSVGVLHVLARCFAFCGLGVLGMDGIWVRRDLGLGLYGCEGEEGRGEGGVRKERKLGSKYQDGGGRGRDG